MLFGEFAGMRSFMQALEEKAVQLNSHWGVKFKAFVFTWVCIQQKHNINTKARASARSKPSNGWMREETMGGRKTNMQHQTIKFTSTLQHPEVHSRETNIEGKANESESVYTMPATDLILAYGHEIHQEHSFCAEKHLWAVSGPVIQW